MSKNIWEEFDEKIDVEGLAKDAQEAAENGGGNYKEVPLGTYEVEVNKMELTKSKKGDPMLTIWFKILTGDYKGSLIFYNQVLNIGFGVHNANEMLLDRVESITGNLEYALKYDKNSKGYNTYEIKDVFEN